MPIPTPTKNETENHFMSRCMSAVAGEFDQDQASAVCHGKWADRNKVKKSYPSKVPLWSGLSVDSMTHDQVVVAKAAIDDVLGFLCGCEFAKAEGAEMPGEAVLRSMLFVEWGNGEDAAATAAIKKIGAGGGAVTEAELASVLKLVDNTLQSDFVDPVSGKLPSIMTRWYRKAKKGVTAAKGLDPIWNAIDTQATAWLSDHHMFWVGDYYDRHLSEALRIQVAEGIKAGLGRTEIAEGLQNFFGEYPGVKNPPLSYWRGFAANGMNRTRQFGLLQSWEDVGIKELEVLAVMDERTSDICRDMNGRIIPVSNGLAQRDLLMAAEDPEDTKTISPWPKIEDLKGKSTKNVMNQGVVTPPYHFYCRTTLVER